MEYFEKFLSIGAKQRWQKLMVYFGGRRSYTRLKRYIVSPGKTPKFSKYRKIMKQIYKRYCTRLNTFEDQHLGSSQLLHPLHQSIQLFWNCVIYGVALEVAITTMWFWEVPRYLTIYPILVACFINSLCKSHLCSMRVTLVKGKNLSLN